MPLRRSHRFSVLLAGCSRAGTRRLFKLPALAILRVSEAAEDLGVITEQLMASMRGAGADQPPRIRGKPGRG